MGTVAAGHIFVKMASLPFTHAPDTMLLLDPSLKQPEAISPPLLDKEEPDVAAV